MRAVLLFLSITAHVWYIVGEKSRDFRSSLRSTLRSVMGSARTLLAMSMLVRLLYLAAIASVLTILKLH